MKIIKNTIKDIGSDLESFFEKDEGTNYVVPTEVRFFCHDNNGQFTMENLKDIFFNVADEIEGEIVSVSMKEIGNHIENCMAYYCDGTGGAISEDNEFISKRVNTFWNIMQKNIHLPPIKTYEHYSTLKGYFGIGGMWHFCYILMNKKSGIVVCAGAYS